MMLFLFLALVATAVAVVILVRPLLRYAAQSPDPSQRTGGGAWRMALIITLALPMLALALYAGSGRPLAWMTSSSGGGAQIDSVSQIRASIAELADKLEGEPDNAEGWLLLARSYQGTGLIAESLSAYARVYGLKSEDPDFLVEYANALSRQNGRSLAGKPAELLDHARQLEPDNLNVLALSGAAALQRGDAEAAQAFWVRLRDLTPADSPDRERVEALLVRARGGTSENATPRTAALPAPGTAAAPMTALIKGVVNVSPDLAGRVAQGDTLFIYARESSGASIPIAVVRKQAVGWPVRFALDDQASMGQGQPLSSFKHVDIVARISHSGNPSVRPGDLEGVMQGVAVGADAIELIIDRVVED